MTTKKKIERIESLIESVRKDGYRIDIVDNEKITFSSPNTREKNTAIFEKAEKKSAHSKNLEGNYGMSIGAFLEGVTYDYEIYIH